MPRIISFDCATKSLGVSIIKYGDFSCIFKKIKQYNLFFSANFKRRQRYNCTFNTKNNPNDVRSHFANRIYHVN